MTAVPNLKQFKLPDVGEGLTEAEIVKWHVKAGDPVEINQTIVEIETAKAIVELPCPYEGVVAELMVNEGDTVDVGVPIISVDVAGEAEPEPPRSQPSTQAALREDLVPSPAADPGTHIGPGTGPEPKREPVLVGYGVKPGATRRRPRKTSAHQAASAGAHSPAASASGTAHGLAAGASAAAAGGVATSRPQAVENVAGRAVALAKPPVRKLAKDLGVDLTTIAGTGPHGSITREDVQGALASPGAGAASSRTGPDAGAAPGRTGTTPGGTGTAPGGTGAAPGGTGAAPGGTGAASGFGQGAPAGGAVQAGQAAGSAGLAAVPGMREERIPVRGVRKSTAAAMTGSAFTAPHVTEFLQVDVTATMDAVRRMRTLPEFADVKVSPLLLVAKALLVAVRRHPMINSSWQDGPAGAEIVVKHYVNLGIAAATERGLLVPNIKDAHDLALPDLARALGTLAETARSGRAQPADLADGTITITNVGVFGVDAGTPILVPGEAAILAFGQVRDMPWVHEGELAIRKVTTLALSFDHRIVDGELGSYVLRDVGAMLEDPLRITAWS